MTGRHRAPGIAVLTAILLVPAPAGALQDVQEPEDRADRPGEQSEATETGKRRSRLPSYLRRPVDSPAMSDREAPATEGEAARMLEALLPRFADMSRRYERYALRFTCRETLRTASYSWRRGDATSERNRSFDYLLVFDEDRSRYDVLRETYDKFGRPSGNAVDLDLRAPDAYAWTFLFSARNQRVMNFRYLGREIKDFRLTHVVEFLSAVPYVEGHDTREWSGTAWIEDKTFNLVRIEASPSFQDRRLAGQWRVYTESWNLPWGKSKPRPKGQDITVEFNYTRENLLFPTRVDLRQFVWVARGRDVTDRRVVLEYTDYRFFQTEAEVVDEPAPERR